VCQKVDLLFGLQRNKRADASHRRAHENHLLLALRV